MDSDKSDEDEHEAISKQIVDYYKKYSLSQQLPKYFSGTSLSYMPKIVKDEEIIKPLVIVEDASKIVEKRAEHSQTDVEETAENKLLSPASSVASNRKLEWDSGADIGYNNYNKTTKLHKSLSLPTLTATVSKKLTEKLPETKLTSQIVSVVSYATPSDDKPLASSSSSSSYPAEAPAESSTSSSDDRPQSAKPVSSSSSSGGRPPSAKPVSSTSSSFATTLAYLKSKIGTPDAESTPKIVISTSKLRKNVINLCITKPILIECRDGKKKKVVDRRIQTSFVEKFTKSVQTGESFDKIDELALKKPQENQSVIIVNYDKENGGMTSSNSTQTDSEMIQSCNDSFEYNNLKRTEAQSDLVISTDSSKDLPLLGQLISRKQSKSLVGDIDKSIEILHKLLKSKKYDPTTKKRYIKKIVEKIVDTKYNEDSTTSSELFRPKKPEPKIQQKLQENIPWYPPRMSKFSVKTFSDEFLPDSSKKRSMFTVSETRDTPVSCMESYSSLEKQQSTSGSYQSWKEDKTFSEKLLEEKHKGQGDQVVKFAMKERQHQIAWINDEISHLTKLKGLLEKDKIQTTTVYMLSQQYTNGRTCTPENCPKLNPQRNYVIQTELSSTTSADDVVAYNIYDKEGVKNYQVENGTAKNGRKKVVGDIEVASDEKTTNIKIKTRRERNVLPDKYDTYPRSRAEEERCWPCGMIKKKADRFQNNDVQVGENISSIIRKVDEIVNKYAKKRITSTSVSNSGESIRSSCKCECQCKGLYCHCCKFKKSLKVDKASKRSLDKYETCRCKNFDKNDIDIIVVQNSDSYKSDKESSKSSDVQYVESLQKPKDSDDTLRGIQSCQCKCQCKGLGSCLFCKSKFKDNNKGVQYDKTLENESYQGKGLGGCHCKFKKAKDVDEISKEGLVRDIEYNRPLQSDKSCQCTCQCKGLGGCVCCKSKSDDKDRGVQYDKPLQTDKSCQCKGFGGCASCKLEKSKDHEISKEVLVKDVQYDRPLQSDKSCQCICHCEGLRSCLRCNKDTKSCQCNILDNKSEKSSNTVETSSKISEGVETNRRYNESKSTATDLIQKTVCNQDVQCIIDCKCKTDKAEKITDTAADLEGQVKNAEVQCICNDNAKTQTEDLKLRQDLENDLSQYSQGYPGSGKLPGEVPKNEGYRYGELSENERISGKVSAEGKRWSGETFSSSSSSSSGSYSSGESMRSCLCCKKKNVKEKVLLDLKKKLSNRAYPLCQPCYRENRRCAYSPTYYNIPGHVCSCYTVVETKTLDAIKQTINDLNELNDEFCSCANMEDCCQYCRKKLKMTSRNKNGVAYLLTFESTSFTTDDWEKKRSRKPLEEIKIKVPKVRKKKHKDKENKRRKKGDRSGDSEENDSVKPRKNTQYSLQEYLKQNRPDFVEMAEDRRKAVLDSKMQREEMAECNKLCFFQNYLKNDDKMSKRLFSEKEMKEITKRNYWKLPEVQQKLVDNREKQIRQANRLLVDTFNKKLRENVLKGKRSLPTNVNVVNL